MTFPVVNDFKHQPRKRFGQNFLHDRNVIDKIIRIMQPRTDDFVVEIGPGQGALTGPLLEKLETLHVIELDFDLIPALQEMAASQPGKLIIHQGDALKFDFAKIAGNNRKLRIIGNLPYNISTPLLFHLLDSAHLIEDIHVMLQKEVVDRLAAKPGTADYGRLSVMMQFRCEVAPLFNVSPGSFRPTPKVDSTVVKLVPHKTPVYPCRDPDALATIVRQAFAQRRKTLRNNLKGILNDRQISSAGINPGARAETLTIPEFIRLSETTLNSSR